MQIRVLLFAAAKEAAQTDSISVQVAEPATAADLLDAVGLQLPQLKPLLPSCRVAVNCCYVAEDAAVAADSEIALIPPVSGG
jgi:molybdopterin converting factor subunit 1